MIREVLDGEAARALAAGTPPLAADAEARLDRAVFDALLRLGASSRTWMTQVENVNANGCDQVCVRYADGRRERVAADGGLRRRAGATWSGLAARAGIEERRFDRGSPRRCRCPMGAGCSR